MKKVRAIFYALVLLLAAVDGGCDGSKVDTKMYFALEKFTKTREIGNDTMVLAYNIDDHSISVRIGTDVVIQGAKVPGDVTEAKAVRVSDRWGDGQQLELYSSNGDVSRVTLYNGIGFLFYQRRIANTESEPRNVGIVGGLSARLTARRAGEVRVLGCDGLTDGTVERTSHCFLAAADPVTRAGHVMGWLTHHKGSGIVLSKQDGQLVEFFGRSEYGKLTIGPGEFVDGETLVIGYFDDVLDGLEGYADLAAKANDVKLNPVTAGYCTWYSSPNGGASNEKAMAEMAEFCSNELTKFGFGVLQIDDKWQISGRDFTTHKPDGPFPSGMTPTAEKITAEGMTAGIWYIPFGWDHTREIFADHQDWFVKRADTGEPYTVHWAGTCLDMTHPEARDFLSEVVARMSKDWGYKYIKIDGLWTGLAAKITYPQPAYKADGLGDAVFHDKDKTNLQAYRSGLKLVRDAAGDDVFILGCNIAQNMRTLGGSFGLVDGMRVGRDIGADWGHILPCVDMGSRLYFFHNRVWYNDPDCLMLRKPLTLDQARSWGSWIGLTGQLNLVSEWLPGLPKERLDVLKRSMPNHGLCARPVDLFSSERAKVWQLTDTRTNVRRDVVGLFNWDDKQSQKVSVLTDTLDLPDSVSGKYVGYDYWGGVFVRPFDEKLEMELAPGACGIVAVVPLLDRPQLVSTSRHVSQGVVDVVAEAWDADTKVLTGASKVVVGDEYEMRIVLPKGWELIAGRVKFPEDAGGKWISLADMEVERVQAGAKIGFIPEANCTVEWEYYFRDGVAAEHAEPVKVEGLTGAIDEDGRVILTWEGKASVYQVRRNDGKVSEVAGARFVDGDAEAGRTYVYNIAPLDYWTGDAGGAVAVRVIMPKAPEPAPLPPMPDVNLSDIKPVSLKVGWGTFVPNKSIKGNVLSVNKVKYEKGLGLHAPAEAVYDCKPEYKRFVAVAGLDDEEVDDRCSVQYFVYADKKLLAKSPVLKWKTNNCWNFDVEIPAQTKRLRFVVTDAGDGVACDHADWVRAGFVTK